jgi:hypothetical protein
MKVITSDNIASNTFDGNNIGSQDVAKTAAKVPFDVTNPVYQISSEYGPDKESSWPHPKEEGGKCMISLW